MKLNIKRILRQIPILKRIYTSISIKIFKLSKKKYFLVNFMGINFKLNIKEPIDKSILLFDYYENEQIETSIDLISKNKIDIFFDIGANCGIYSLIFANKFNNLQIYSFEPIVSSLKKFAENIKINKNFKNIKLYNFGLSNKNTILKMKALVKNDHTQLGGFGVLNKGDNLENKFLTEANFKKGDDCFKFKKKTIFLKIDVEGHELQVLDGLNELLNYNKIILQIEILPKNIKVVKKKLLKLKFIKLKKIDFDYYFTNKN